jgi:hypothetical protein
MPMPRINSVNRPVFFMASGLEVSVCPMPCDQPITIPSHGRMGEIEGIQDKRILKFQPIGIPTQDNQVIYPPEKNHSNAGYVNVIQQNIYVKPFNLCKKKFMVKTKFFV